MIFNINRACFSRTHQGPSRITLFFLVDYLWVSSRMYRSADPHFLQIGKRCLSPRCDMHTGAYKCVTHALGVPVATWYLSFAASTHTRTRTCTLAEHTRAHSQSSFSPVHEEHVTCGSCGWAGDAPSLERRSKGHGRESGTKFVKF